MLDRKARPRALKLARQRPANTSGSPVRNRVIAPQQFVSSEFGVSEVGVGIAMRRLQARQASRQMCRQMGQIGQVDHNHGCRCRFTVAAEPLCANVGETPA